MVKSAGPPSLVNDRYRLSEWLGQGSTGLVYQAIDEMLNRPVVIKFLVPERSAVAQERFLREARSAARLSHPNIMTIYDVGSQEGWDYLVLEYIPGKDLHTLLHEIPTPLPSSQTIEIIQVVLAALAYAHDHGIIHRDIKPENIRITPDSQLKLTDFSLALAAGESRLTQESMVVGTAQYLAPECLLGQSADARSDLYSVGAIFYEITTGHPPFCGEPLTGLIGAILYAPVVPPRQHAPNLSPAVEAFILRLLSRDPSQRYPSAHEALLALNHIVAADQAASHGPDPYLQQNQVEPSTALEEERRRFASLLQSRVIEPLILLQSQSATFEQTLGGQPSTRMALSVISSLVRQIIQQVHDLSESIHPSALENLGLEAALETLKDQLSRSTGLNLTLELQRLPERLPVRVEVTVFRLIQDILEAVAMLPAFQATLRLTHHKNGISLYTEWATAHSLPDAAVQSLSRHLTDLNARLETGDSAGRPSLTVHIPLRAPIDFTIREMEVLQALVEGLSNKQIAAQLSISPRTVNFHLDHIYAKLGVNTRTEAAVIAQHYGWARRRSNMIAR